MVVVVEVEGLTSLRKSIAQECLFRVYSIFFFYFFYRYSKGSSNPRQNIVFNYLVICADCICSFSLPIWHFHYSTIVR